MDSNHGVADSTELPSSGGDVVVRAKAALEDVPDGEWVHVGGGHVEGRQGVPVAKVWGLNKAEFIAAARTLVPELVAEVEKLRRALADVAIDQYMREHGLTGIKSQPVSVGVLSDEHRDRQWTDAKGHRWRWDDINGWVVDDWAAHGGFDPEGHGPFSEVA